MRAPAAARPSPSVEPVMKIRGTGIILPPVVCWYRSAVPGKWPGEPVYRARAGSLNDENAQRWE